MVWVWSMSCGDGVGVVHELWGAVGMTSYSASHAMEITKYVVHSEAR